MVSNIFSQALTESQLRTESLNSEYNQPRCQQNVDKLAIIRAYEEILRNEGILPVSDSRIYNLVLKIFKKFEDSQNENQQELTPLDFRLQHSLGSLVQLNEKFQKASEYDHFRLKRRVLRGLGQKQVPLSCWSGQRKEKRDERKYISSKEKENIKHLQAYNSCINYPRSGSRISGKRQTDSKKLNMTSFINTSEDPSHYYSNYRPQLNTPSCSIIHTNYFSIPQRGQPGDLSMSFDLVPQKDASDISVNMKHSVDIFDTNNFKSNRYFSNEDPVLNDKAASEYQYKVAFKHLRMWQRAVKNIKQARIQKKIDIENLALAIHFNDQSLKSKTLLSIIRARIKRENEQHNTNAMRQRVLFNIASFYFNQIKYSYFDKISTEKYQLIADENYSQSLKIKVLFNWKGIAKFRRREVCLMGNQIQRDPIYAKVLVDFIGGWYMNSENFDLLDFHAFAYDQERVIPSRQNVFNKTIGQSVLRTNSQLFGAWKERVQEIVQFKNTIIMRSAWRCFQAFKRYSFQQCKLQNFQAKRQCSIKYKIFSSLGENLSQKVYLRFMHQKLIRKQRNNVLEKYFDLWVKNYEFMTNVMKESQSSNTLSLLSFQKKYFYRMKTHTYQSQKKRYNYSVLSTHIHKKYVLPTFQQLKSYTKNRSQLASACLAIKKKHSQKIKTKFFDKWSQLFDKYWKATIFSEIQLKEKCWKNCFLKIMEFREIKRQIHSVATNHYQLCLQGNCFRLLQAYKELQQEKFSRQQSISRFLTIQTQKRIFTYMRQYKQLQIKGKELRGHSKQFFLVRSQQKVIKALRSYGLNKKRLSKLSKITEEKHSKRVLMKSFYTMMSTKNKKYSYEMLKQYFVAYRYSKIIKKSLSIWWNRYYSLQEKEKTLIQNSETNLLGVTFQHWYMRSFSKIDIKRKHVAFQVRRKQNIEQETFKNWISYINQKRYYERLKKLSAFAFLQKFLKKTLLALRQYSLIRQSKNNLTYSYQLKVLRECFYSLSYYSSTQAKIKFLNKKAAHKTQQQATSVWRFKVRQNNILREGLQSFSLQKEEAVLRKYMNALIYVKDFGIEDDQICEATLQQKKERIRKKHTFNGWKKIAEKKQNEIQKVEFMQQRIERDTKGQILKRWAEECYLEYLTLKKSLPFQDAKEKERVKDIFECLKWTAQYKKHLVKNYLQISQTYQTNLQLEALRTLYAYSQHRKEKRTNIFYIKYLSQNNLKLHAWNCLVYYQDQKQAKVLNTDKSKNFAKLQLSKQFFRVWKSKHQRKMRLYPKIEQANLLYFYYLSQKVILSLKQNKSLMMQKRQREANVSKYWREQQVTKYFCYVKQHYLNMKKERRATFKIQKRIKAKVLKTMINVLHSRIQFKFKQEREQKGEFLGSQHSRGVKIRCFQYLKKEKDKCQEQKKRLGSINSMIQKKLRGKFVARLVRICQKQILEEKREAYVMQQANKKVWKKFKENQNSQRVKREQAIKCAIFNNFRLQQFGFKQLSQNTDYKKKLDSSFLTTNSRYKDHLLENSFMTLQLFKIRRKYMDGIYERSRKFREGYLQAKLFKLIKKQLIKKYVILQVSQKRQLRVLTQVWSEWREQFEELENAEPCSLPYEMLRKKSIVSPIQDNHSYFSLGQQSHVVQTVRVDNSNDSQIFSQAYEFKSN